MSLDGIRDHLAYDPDTGVFTWLTESKRSPRKVGDRAGTIRPDGRRVIWWRGKLHLSYRLAWFFVHGEMPTKGLDHANRDPSDDRIANLRPSGQSENMMNTVSHKDSRSKFKGVWWHKGNHKWVADFRGKYIGSYFSEEDAARAYDAAAEKHNAQFARLNFNEERVL